MATYNVTNGLTLSRGDYTVGWVCALPVERACATSMLDQVHCNFPVLPTDHNTYTLGRIGNHNIVVACLPNGEYGIASAATVAMQLLSSFPSIRFGLMVGIGGGAPSKDADIRLGDIVVSKPTKGYGGVIQYDYGKAVYGGLERTGILNQPPRLMLTALAALEANHLAGNSRVPEFLSEMTSKLGQNASNFMLQDQEDRLYHADYQHVIHAMTCELCDRSKIIPRPLRTTSEPVVHYGLIASGNQVVKDSHFRDRLSRELGAYCVEMEAAGLMNDFPCLVIRGICDYADSHKNKEWQGYAAAAAAAYAKELLLVTPTLEDTSSASGKFNIPLDLSNIPAIDQFVGRNEDLNILWSLLQPSASAMRKVVVFHGLGGIGKTQLAIRFARLHQNDYSAIFWLNGKTKDSLLRSLADQLNKLPGVNLAAELKTEDETEQAAKQVLQWLAISNNCRWLLIFDNIDTYTVQEQLGDGYYDVTKIFPPTDHGSIIITTRVPQMAEIGHSYPVLKLQPGEAVTLLIESSGLRTNITSDFPLILSDIATLAKRLDGLPLAIVIAGSYIQQTGISFSMYLEIYSQSWKDLQQRGRPYRSYSNGNLLGTWMISYEEIQRNNPAAAKLFLLLACYDNQDIWYDLIHQGLHGENQPEWLYKVISNKMDFLDAIQALRNFSLIHAKPGSNSYSLHPVVQDWCLGYIQDEVANEMNIFALISIGLSVVTSDKQYYWILQRRLLPHADRMFQMVQDMNFDPEDSILLGTVNSLGILYADQGRLQEAETMYQRALVGKEKSLGLDHTSTLQTVNNLGNLYADQGRLRDAETMYQRALAGNEKALGPDHTSTLDTVNNLGLLYVDQGRLQDAETMYRRALAGKEKALGLDHTSTLDTVNNLGLLYKNQGRLQDAETMYQRALVGKEKALGPDHTSTLDTINNLGNLYADQGRLQEAKVMYQRALAGNEKALGPDHRSTLDTVNNLGLLYADRGRLQDAETMYRRALAGKEKSLGPDHMSILDTVNNLGILYKNQGKLQEAETMYQRALAGYEKSLGPDHTSTLRIVNNLGNLYKNQVKLQDAETMYQRAVAGNEKALGPDHTSVLQTVNNLGNLYAGQGRLQEAETMYQRALAGYEKALGPNHTSTLQIVNNLGNLYTDQGKLQEAETVYQRTLAAKRRH